MCVWRRGQGREGRKGERGRERLFTNLIIIIQKYGLLKAKKAKDVDTAEKKILITFCSYVLLTVVALTLFTIATKVSEPFVDKLSNYFVCEGKGNDPCDRNAFRQLIYPWLTVVSHALIFLLPAVNLVYALNIKELKEKFNIMKTLKFSSTAQTHSSNMSTL